eukprot:XP_025015393.1 cation/H(+) antiporter 20-like [Ricinus communis]
MENELLCWSHRLSGETKSTCNGFFPNRAFCYWNQQQILEFLYRSFVGVALSITAFLVLARILAELKLLTTQVGETTLAAAAFNNVAAWILLALAIALAGNDAGAGYKSPLISIWIANRCSRQHGVVNEAYICLTLAGVMVSGFITDLIGIHSIFGAFIFGLTIPRGIFAERLIERIEDFVSGLLCI